MESQKSLLKRVTVNRPMRVAALAGAAMLLSHGSAQAGLVLDFNNNALIVTDNGPGDSDSNIGEISTVSSIGGFGVQITVSEANSPGNATDGTLQIQSLDITNDNPGPATLTIRVSDNGYTLPGGAATPMLLGSAMGGTFTNAGVGDTVQFQSFADPANAQPATAVSTADLTFTNPSTSATPNSFSGNNNQPWIRGAGAYSMTSISIVTLSPNATANISGSTTATTTVPEPIFGAAGLLAVGLLGRRRRH